MLSNHQTVNQGGERRGTGGMGGGESQRWTEMRGKDGRKEIREEEEYKKCEAMQGVEKEKGRPGGKNTRTQKKDYLGDRRDVVRRGEE